MAHLPGSPEKEFIMGIPRRKSFAVAAVVGAALTLLTPTAASAAYFGSETDYAVESAGPTGVEGEDYFCTSYTGVRVCWMPEGDKFFVKDTKEDRYAAVAQWSWNYRGERTGSCVNKLGYQNDGYKDWGVCNKDFVENKPLTILATRYNSGNYVDGEDYYDRLITGS